MQHLASVKPLPHQPLELLDPQRRSFLFRYGLAILLVIAPLLLTLVVRRAGLTLNPTWPVLISFLLISWYAGRGPCLLAAVLFELVLNLFFSQPLLVFKVNMAEINRLLILLILGWIASARSQAENNLRKRARQQQAVAWLAERALIERDFQVLLNQAVELVAQTLQIEFPIVWESVAEKNQLLARAGVGWRAGVVGHARIEADPKSLAGQVLLSGGPVMVKDLRHPKQASLSPILREHGIISGLGVSLPRALQTVSVLAAYSRRKQVFSPEDVNFLQTCAYILAEAAERLRIEREREELLIREQKARASAEEASRLKDEFLTTVSHELRTPLNSILGWVTLIRKGECSAEETAQALQTIERNARAQAQIVSDILDVSRIITGRLRIDFSVVELASVLHTAVESMLPTAAAKGVKLALHLNAVDALINGDANRLQQIIWNLLANAIKFTPAGGSVTVELAQRAAHYEIQVRDQGVGISQDFLPYVFDRFRQADSSSSRRYGGLGLGLSVVRHLVELQGGTVSVTSDGLGQGATFTILLPVLSVAEAAQPKPSNVPAIEALEHELVPEVKIDLTGLTILVVDDEPDARSVVTVVLEQCGAQVFGAASAAEALDQLTQRHHDVIVSDIGMPGEDGFSFIRQVRAMGPEHGGAIPAVALTSFTQSESRLKALQAGFQTHIAKPVHPTELLLVVASLANRT